MTAGSDKISANGWKLVRAFGAATRDCRLNRGRRTSDGFYGRTHFLQVLK